MQPERSGGQSLVEMAFVAPILLLLFFGIIDMGWYVYSYATISQAARNGAEVAAQLPPYQSWLDYETTPPGDAKYNFRNDPCVNTILTAISSDATLFGGAANGGLDIASTDYVTISYPAANTRNLRNRGPIEITISYPVSGLTPLFNLLRIGDGSGAILMTVTARRSIESMGVSPDPRYREACIPDMAEWYLRQTPTP